MQRHDLRRANWQKQVARQACMRGTTTCNSEDDAGQEGSGSVYASMMDRQPRCRVAAGSGRTCQCGPRAGGQRPWSVVLKNLVRRVGHARFHIAGHGGNSVQTSCGPDSVLFSHGKQVAERYVQESAAVKSCLATRRGKRKGQPPEAIFGLSVAFPEKAHAWSRRTQSHVE